MIADVILKAVEQVVKLIGLALDGDELAEERLSHILDDDSKVELAAARQDKLDRELLGPRR